MLMEVGTEICKQKYFDEPDPNKQLKPVGNDKTAPYFVEKPKNYATNEST